MSHEQGLLVLALELKMKARGERHAAAEHLKEADALDYEVWQLEEAANNKTYLETVEPKVAAQ